MSKLLLVEDDNNLREIYEARLQAEGYTIVTAKDGEEALVVAKAEKPDLIISDIMMPKISGFEMLDILRNTENLKSVPVIMLTALGQNDDQQRADKLGADRYLVKSQVTLEDIVKVTHELLGDEPAADPAATTTPDPASTTPPTATLSTPPAPDPAPAPLAATPPAPVIPEAPETPTPPEAPTAAPAVPPADDAVATPPVDTPAPAAPLAADPPAATPEPAPTADPDPAPAPLAATPPAPVIPEAPETPTPPEAPTAEKPQPDAQTIAQEGAAVEARIEDFVTGASEEATPPAGKSAPSSTADAAADDPATTSSPAPPKDIDPAAIAGEVASVDAENPVDQEAINEAVQNIEVKTAEQASTPETPPDTSDAATAETSTNLEPSTAGKSTVVHDKVIQPLETDPKKDINTLLALEAVKEANGHSPSQPQPVIVDTAQAASTTTPAPKPNATALGASPTPSSVIAPVSPEMNPADLVSESAAITKSASATAPQAATEEPGADLNGIAL
jgi:CheY-like chemotaxis protein